MSDFTPGVERARAAGHSIQVAPYPLGAEGIRVSLAEVAKKVRDGRLDPDVRGWAGDVLIAAGRPESVQGKIQALLDAFRHETTYQPDPVGAEYIVSAAGTVCLRPGLCVRARDCDDGTVFMGSTIMSIGIPVEMVKQYFGPNEQEHVLIEAQDEQGNWLSVDPSTDLPVGRSVPAVSEERIDPMSVVGSAGTAGAEIVTLGATPVARLLVRAHTRRTGEPTWDGRHYWIATEDRRFMVWVDGRWQYADPGLPLAGPPEGLGAGFTTPGDVLAYRKTWDAYVLGMVSAAQQCAAAWDAQAAGSAPGTPVNLAQFALAPDKTTLTLWANAQRVNADSILADWNAHANTPDWQLLAQAEDILVDFQRIVLKVGQYYAPQIARDCPGIELPAPPSFDLQAQVIGRLEGAEILAHGSLQLLGMGAGGALETYGAIGRSAATVGEKLADNTPWIAGAIIVVAATYAAVQLVPMMVSRRRAA